MKPSAGAANSVWWLASMPAAARLRAAMGDVERSQTELLMANLRRNAGTEYGRRFGFAGIGSVKEFQERVPLVGYDDLEPMIQRMAGGEPDVLIPGRPAAFVPTSGSTAATKLIPYNRALRGEFQEAVSAWVAGMFRTYPGIVGGRAFWSVSPVTQPDRLTAGGIPIGYDDDVEYLSPALARLLALAMAVPSTVARIPDMDAFRYVTLAFLLRSRDLSFISVWNPTFLTLLLSQLARWGESLARDLARGTLTPPGDIPTGVLRQLRGQFGRAPDRAREVGRALSTGAPRFEQLWPGLAVVSCWTAAAAAGPAAQLQRLLPGVRLAPKGLLATEGVVSIPVAGREGHALAVRSHFFEFLPVGGGEARTAWQVEEGRTYQVVLTTGGGLYRYRLGDIVRISGFVRSCPLVEFLGRHSRVSDLRGEKLEEGHVGSAIRRAAERLGLHPEFVLVAPDGTDSTSRGRGEDHPQISPITQMARAGEAGSSATGECPGYALFVAGGDAGSDGRWQRLAREVERGLCENIHYDYCRRLGQLAPLECVPLALSANEAAARYSRVMLSRGLRAGDIKPAFLDAGRDWRRVFTQGVELASGTTGRAAGPRPTSPQRP